MVKKLILESITGLIKAGSKLVSEDEAKERLDTCNKCENKGIVELLPMVTCEGCKLCGCPLETITKINKNILLGEALCKAGKWDAITEKYDSKRI